MTFATKNAALRSKVTMVQKFRNTELHYYSGSISITVQDRDVVTMEH